MRTRRQTCRQLLFSLAVGEHSPGIPNSSSSSLDFPPDPIGVSAIRIAERDTIRGKNAVSANMPRGPHDPTSEPEKYALAIAPTACDAQQSDCSEPATVCVHQPHTLAWGHISIVEFNTVFTMPPCNNISIVITTNIFRNIHVFISVLLYMYYMFVDTDICVH